LNLLGGKPNAFYALFPFSVSVLVLAGNSLLREQGIDVYGLAV
jgi:hypothetical protein